MHHELKVLISPYRDTRPLLFILTFSKLINLFSKTKELYSPVNLSLLLWDINLAMAFSYIFCVECVTAGSLNFKPQQF